MERHGRRLLCVAWLLAASCAHAPAAPLAPVAWPAPPAAPLIRLAAVLPLSGAAPARSGLGRLLDLVTGEERDPAPGEQPVRPAGLASADGRRWAVADPDAPGVFLLAEGAAPVRLACPEAPWGAPMAVAWRADGALVVADAARGQVLLVRDGRCQVVLGGLERPIGVAVAGGRIFAVDGPRREVVAADPGGGIPLRFGAEVLTSPVAIAATLAGDLLVADALDARVVRFSSDGRVLGTVGGRAPEAGGLLRPKGMATDSTGRIFVLEASEDRITVFGADGRLLAHLGEHGADPGRFWQATGLAIGAARLGVADASGRVQIFELLGGTS